MLRRRIQPLGDTCHAGCAFTDILGELGLSAADLASSDAVAPTVSRQDRLRAARRIWDVTCGAAGKIAERYLRNRGLNLPMPPSLRYVPLIWHEDFGWPFPALVAGAQDVDGKFSGIQVTRLAADGRDKAPIEVPRRTVGPIQGAAMRLAPPGPTLVLCEGLETGLSVLQSTGLPTWVTFGCENLAHVALPDVVETVIIGADADAAGERAAAEAVQAFQSQGRRARIVRPPDGFKDFNDVLMDACG
jgi:DNA primase